MLPPIIILGALLWGCSSDPDPIFSSLDSDDPDAQPANPDSFDGGIDNGSNSDLPDLVIPPETISINETSDIHSDTPDSPEITILPPDKDGDNYYVCSSPAEELAVLNAGGLCGDCDDTNPSTYPGAPDRINGQDNNCDNSNVIDLNTSAVAFVGEADGDEAGNNAMAMGDINGGGDDVIIGSAVHSTQPFYNEGKVYVKFGGAEAPEFGTKVYLGSASDVTFNGAGGWGLGGSVATRDLNGDGKAELLMSASGFNNGQCGGTCGDGDGSESGALVLMRGRKVWESAYHFYDIDVTDPVVLKAHQMGLVLGQTDTEGDSLVSFQMLEDMDGNNSSEILLRTGNTQRCNIIPALAYEGIWTVGEIMATEKSYQIFGGGAEDVCNNVASGDVNGDGFADILLGDPVDFKNKAKGKVWLLHGSNNLPAWPAVINLSQLTALSPINYGTFSGAGNGYEGGHPVEMADLNGDGRDEIIIGVGLEDGPFDHSGRIHIIDGDQYTKARQGLHPKVSLKNGDNLVLDSSIFELGGKAIYGDKADAQIGDSITANSDTNGDGINDLFVGAPLFTDGNEGAGFFYSGATIVLTPDVDVITNAAQMMIGKSGSALGFSSKGGGDINSDGVDDILVNAFGAPALSKKGITYLFCGGK